MTATLFHNCFQVCTMYCALLKDQLDHLNWTQWTAVFIVATLLVKFPFFIHYMAVHYDYKPVKKGTEDRLPEVVKMWGIVATCKLQAVAAFLGVFDFAHYDNWHNDTVSRIGLAVAVISLLGAVWVHFSMGSSWSGTVTVQKTHTLVTTGPFKLCRHPMYASCLLQCLAVALMSQNWLLTAFFTLPMMGLVSRILREEKLMIEVFGQQYIDYKKQVGAFWPWKGRCDCGLSDAEAEEVLKKREEELKDKKE